MLSLCFFVRDTQLKKKEKKYTDILKSLGVVELFKAKLDEVLSHLV